MSEYIVGRNPVLEALRSGQTMQQIYLEQGERKGSAKKIFAMAKEKNIPVLEVPRQKLENISQGANHQGVAAKVESYRYHTYEEILKRVREKGETPFFVLLDRIQDPHNLGAILRTCDAAGVNGVFIPKHRSADITPVVHKTSAGATNYVPVAKVTNLSDTILKLKEEGLWIYGAAGEAQKTLYDTDLTGSVGIVIGNEGKGMGKRVQDSCDMLLRIPMKGNVDSLNASNAAAIILYEVVRQHEGA